MFPPMTPKLMTGCPWRVRKAGMMVWKGRLPGATRLAVLAEAGSVLNPWPRFCKLMPKVGSTTPDPKPM